MKLLSCLMAFFLMMIFSLQASVVAVIDSGTDINHEELKGKIWTNIEELPQNEADDDGNGYVDDYHGWNFAENNAKLIDYQYLNLFDENVRTYFELQTKYIQGIATQEEIQQMRRLTQDQEFLKKLQTYGNFMHGTHVAGIVASGSNTVQVLPIKLIPTEVKLPFNVQEELRRGDKGLGMTLFKGALAVLAKQQMKLLTQISQYLYEKRVEIANGSFGTGYPQIRTIIEMVYKRFASDDTTPAEQEKIVDELTTYFMTKLIKNGQTMVGTSPKTLFVFAAGNDGTDSDAMPTSPAGIRADNSITVAATLDRVSLASFSNFGSKSVDVAAPGVGIRSSVPGDEYLRVSGTSQAAPYVANIASRIKDENKSLSPKQIKRIIMGTVDLKDYLIGKVITGGVVNQDRAVLAASLSHMMSVDQAIVQAKRRIVDQPVRKENLRSNLGDIPLFIPMPGLVK